MPTPRRIFVPDAAPPPETARYAHAVEFGDTLHITGQLQVDPDDPDGTLPPSIEERTDIVFLNLNRILDAAGYRLENTIFARIYLANFDRDYAGLNQVYHRYFHNRDHLPARTTVGVATLGRGALVEIDLIVAGDS